MIDLLSSVCIYLSSKTEIYVAASTAPRSNNFLWSSAEQWVHISFRITPSGPITPAQLDTNWQFCLSAHAIMGWLPLICALLGSRRASESLWADLRGLGTGWQSGGLSPTWARKLNHPRQQYPGFLKVSSRTPWLRCTTTQARYHCMRSKLGASVAAMQLSLLELSSGQIRLGLSMCNGGTEIRSQGEFAFAKNIIIT